MDESKTVDILLITGGLAPPLVTETLYAIGQDANKPRARDPFWPTQVIVAGTSANRQAFEAGALRQQIVGLCAALRRSVPDLRFETPEGDIRDVRTGPEAEAFGSLVARLVREITNRPDTRLHLSLAGGRKTMSFHAGAALQLYGRDRDCLSHVLIEPMGAETASNFWYPTLTDLMLTGRDGKPVVGSDGLDLNARYVEVDKAEIPYFSVRDLLPPSLLKRDLNYAEVTRAVSMALGQTPITLTLIRRTRHVVVAGLPPIYLPHQEFAFYQILCERAKYGFAGAGRDGEGEQTYGWLSDRLLREPQFDENNAVSSYLMYHEKLRNDGNLPAEPKEEKPVREDTRVTPTGNTYKEMKKAGDRSIELQAENLAHFRTLRSRLKKRLKIIPNDRVRKALYDEIESRDGVRFGLDIAPGAISFV